MKFYFYAPRDTTRTWNIRIRTKHVLLQVRGVIFDSAPGERRLTALFKAISAIIGGHPLTNLPMSFIITFLLSVLWFFEVKKYSASACTDDSHRVHRIISILTGMKWSFLLIYKIIFILYVHQIDESYIISIDRIISRLCRRCTLYMSIYDRQVIAQAFSRSPIPTNPIALAEEAYSWPQLFLYSNSDSLIPASVSKRNNWKLNETKSNSNFEKCQDVEKFASRRAERGVRVQLVLFTNSPHVKHYATYRDVYVNTVCSFIHECLTSPSPSRSLMSLDGDNHDSQNYDVPPGLIKRVVLPHEATKQQN